MSFLKEYNSLKINYKWGEDYIDFKVGGYLLFFPLNQKALRIFVQVTTPAFDKHISVHNCIILHSQGNSAFSPEWHWEEYVLKPYFSAEKFYKCFLIDLRRINYESKVGASFVSFSYSKIIDDFHGTLFDGTGHYFNLKKIHKSKYFKGSTILEENKLFYQKELPKIMRKSLNAFNAKYPDIFETMKIRTS